MNKIKPVVLIILDGWGLSPSWGGNALSMSNPKFIDGLWRNYPHAILQALGAIGDGRVIGESRLGHSLIGTGRLVEGNLSKIDRSIASGEFYRNETLLGAINWAKNNNSNLHLIGLISDGGVHSHIDHLLSLIDLAAREGLNRVFVDAITDGTDSGPTDALKYVDLIEKKFKRVGFGNFSSISGRNLAMDRDKHWDKIAAYYKTLTNEKAEKYESIKSAITQSYEQGINDEFIKPGLIKSNGNIYPIKSNDAVVVFNFREDRSREISRVFIDPNFHTFFWNPKKIKDLYFATFIDYEKDIPAKVAFSATPYQMGLSETISRFNLNQLKIAESEKYAHVTYFFNGGTEDPFPGEDRKIVASPEVDSYDQMPQMSALALTQNCLKAIKSKNYDLIVINFANVDVVAHTGNIMAVGQAIQVVDSCVEKITKAALASGGACIITADHGNAEQMLNIQANRLGDRETMHTLNPVPFILATGQNKKDLILSAVSHDLNALSKIIQAKDTLADVAPTILELMGIPKPPQMTGQSLLNRLE